LAVSHLFICHSSKDAAVARQVVDFLEAKGLTCWISSRDVLAGQNYQEAIVQALEGASGIVFLFSEWSSQSAEIRKELAIGSSVNIPVFPLRLSPITPTGALRYELATRQWIDIFPDPKAALGQLAATIKRTIGAVDADQAPVTPSSREQSPADASRSNGAAPPLQSDRPMEASPVPAPIVATGSPEFEAIRMLLARQIGPIAKVYVEQAASEAHSRDAFCELLAAYITAPSERSAFLQAVRARLAAKS
jgi:hypothetical protein